MFLSNSAVYFVILTALIAECAGCRQSNSVGKNAGTADPTSGRAAAFPTKEPETYQAEVVITAGGIEQKFRCMRKGSASRIDYDLGREYQRSYIRTDADRVVSDRRKLYADVPAGRGGSELQNDTADNMLIRNHYSEIERLGTENGLSKFRAKMDQSTASEAIIYVNDELGLPVREELFSLSPDGGRQLQYTYELRDVRNEVDTGVFEIPQNYKKVSIDEFNKNRRKDQ
ncbi:MAG: hypothetical protein ACR2IH_07125 [Pyrinomonadaceae bacterium]